MKVEEEGKKSTTSGESEAPTQTCANDADACAEERKSENMAERGQENNVNNNQANSAPLPLTSLSGNFHRLQNSTSKFLNKPFSHKIIVIMSATLQSVLRLRYRAWAPAAWLWCILYLMQRTAAHHDRCTLATNVLTSKTNWNLFVTYAIHFPPRIRAFTSFRACHLKLPSWQSLPKWAITDSSKCNTLGWRLAKPHVGTSGSKGLFVPRCPLL